MKVAGIIAEYNPFHNGHKYHLEKVRQCTDADYCIVVMSGNFTQRGEPAVIDKYARTEMALSCGADLVLELPVCYATSSAPYFAQGAVALLDRLGVVDELVFGSESGDIAPLQAAAAVLASEPSSYTALLKAYLKSGFSYPSAQSKALVDYISQHNLLSNAPISNAIHEGILSSPNDILGIEYCKSLLLQQSSITPKVIPRFGSSYTDDTLSQSADSSDTKAPIHSSALAIRTSLQNEALSEIRTHVPETSYRIMQEAYGKTFPVFPHMLSDMLHYRLLTEAERGFTQYLDVSQELSDRICNKLSDYQDFPSFCMLLKTKELTYTRISRSLLHIFLDIRRSDIDRYSQFRWAGYARMLGFRKHSVELLTAIKANASIPLISKLADADRYLEGDPLDQLHQDIQAAHIYNALLLQHYQTKLPLEMQRQIVRFISV